MVDTLKNTGADRVWSVDADWTDGSKPTPSDDVTLNGLSGQVTIDENINVNILLATSYGRLTVLTNSPSITVGGSSALNNLYSLDFSAWVFNGGSSTIRGDATAVYRNMTIALGAVVTAATTAPKHSGNLVIAGTYALGALADINGTANINLSGSITGATGTIHCTNWQSSASLTDLTVAATGTAVAHGGTITGCNFTGTHLTAIGCVDGGGNTNVTFVAGYALTMSQAYDDTGTSPYIAGAVVDVRAADADPGYRFDHWESDYGVAATQFADVTDPTTTFTMPAHAVTAHAVFVAVYTLTVTNGTGDGDYAEGEEATITADAPASAHLFYRWTTADGGVIVSPNSSPSKFIMPANAVEVTASYVSTPAPETAASDMSLGLGLGL